MTFACLFVLHVLSLWESNLPLLTVCGRAISELRMLGFIAPSGRNRKADHVVRLVYLLEQDA